MTIRWNDWVILPRIVFLGEILVDQYIPLIIIDISHILNTRLSLQGNRIGENKAFYESEIYSFQSIAIYVHLIFCRYVYIWTCVVCDVAEGVNCPLELRLAMWEVHVCLAPVDTSQWCKVIPKPLKTTVSPPTCGKREVDASSVQKSRGQGAKGYLVSCCITPRPYQERSTALGGHSDGPLPRPAIW